MRFDADDESSAWFARIAVPYSIARQLVADQDSVVSRRASVQDSSQERPNVPDLIGVPVKCARESGQSRYSVRAAGG
jgi:hypothetical protein